MSRRQDILGLLRGIQLVAGASVKTKKAYLKHLWSHSSVREVIEKSANETSELGRKVVTNPAKELQNVGNMLKETLERSSVVVEGIRQYTASGRTSHPIANIEVENGTKSYSTIKNIKNLDIASITLKELENLLAEHNKFREVNLRLDENFKPKSPSKKVEIKVEPDVKPVKAAAKVETVKITRTPPAPPKPRIEPSANIANDEKQVESVMKFITNYDRSPSITNKKTNSFVPELKVVAKQRTVPSSRIGRVASFGQLFAGLGFGTVQEMTKGALGLGGSKNVRDALFSPQNAERIVDTLCKVRGAALKLGQILSIQDTNVVSPQLIQAFDRVRQAADYMPDWQVERVMIREFGKEWRSKLADFEEKPFAAASIGQVHRGTLIDGKKVAIKIQYPGVAKSIDSDIDNLVSMMKIWNVFPPGMYIDNIVKVAKRELAWEVDYEREAEFTTNFKEMITDFPEFKVPQVYKELSTSRVLTTEFVEGVPMDSCFGLSQEIRNHIAKMVMQLCLLELFQYRCMQTDPNWSNFLYDEESRRLMLIDFGATRFYTSKFMDNYLRVIIAATENNRELVQKLSVEMGFLTGYETQAMEQAHVDAVMILGEVFSVQGEFDFGKQKTTKKIADLVPVMIAHRLCPPPEEIYSLHRKLSGVFLLCYKMQAKVACRPMFDEIVRNYKFSD